MKNKMSRNGWCWWKGYDATSLVNRSHHVSMNMKKPFMCSQLIKLKCVEYRWNFYSLSLSLSFSLFIFIQIISNNTRSYANKLLHWLITLCLSWISWDYETYLKINFELIVWCSDILSSNEKDMLDYFEKFNVCRFQSWIKICRKMLAR